MTDCIKRLNFRAFGLSFVFLPYRLIALSFKRLPKLLSGNYRLIVATFDTPTTFDPHDGKARNHPHEGNVRLTPHEGNEQKYFA